MKSGAWFIVVLSCVLCTNHASACGMDFKNTSGTFATPGYPGSNYANKLNCIWTIEVDEGFRIKVDFADPFDIEPSSACVYDYLKVTEVEADGKVTTRKFCGSTSPNVYYSKGRKLEFNFVSDFGTNHKGFSATFTREVGPIDISITPATLTLTPEQADGDGGIVTITCGISIVPQGHSITALRISFKNSTHEFQSLAKAGADVLNGSALSGNVLQEGSFSTSGSTLQNSISLTLLAASCKDAGLYICGLSMLDKGFSVDDYCSESSLTVEVISGNVSLTASPDPSDVTSRNVDDILVIRCDAAFDIHLNQSQIEWNWDYNDSSKFGKTEWKAFSEIRNADDNITQGDALSKSGCYVKHHSTLRRRLTRDDAARLFRCCVRLGEGEPSCQTLSVDESQAKAGASKGGQNNVVTISLIAVISCLALVILNMTYYVVVIKRRLGDREQLLAQREEALQRANQMRVVSDVTSQNQETDDSASSHSFASSQATDATDTTETHSYF